MTLYPRNAAAALDPALFKHPTVEYRGTPFWAWNTALKRDELLRQIDVLEAMGRRLLFTLLSAAPIRPQR